MRQRRVRFRWQSKWQWLFPVLIYVSVGFLGGFGFQSLRQDSVTLTGDSSLPSTQVERRLEEPRTKEVLGSQRIQERTRVEEKIYFALCDQVETSESFPLPAWVGMDQASFAQQVKPADVLAFSPERVVLFRREAEAVCPEMLNYRTVGIEDGHVAIRYGRPDLLGPLIEVTDIPVAMLLPIDRERLEVGIVVESQEQALRVVEGLSDS